MAKFDAPKATLMSYIIKGILNRQLPWGLVLLGVMIAVVLEMSGIPSLAFAVGVYLPLSSSSPIFIGGMVRWLGDRYVRQEASRAQADRRAAHGRRRQEPRRAAGVRLHRRRRDRRHPHRVHGRASWPTSPNASRRWSSANNPFFEGPSADLLSLIPFALLVGLLYLVGREMIFRPRIEAVAAEV